MELSGILRFGRELGLLRSSGDRHFSRIQLLTAEVEREIEELKESNRRSIAEIRRISQIEVSLQQQRNAMTDLKLEFRTAFGSLDELKRSYFQSLADFQRNLQENANRQTGNIQRLESKIAGLKTKVGGLEGVNDRLTTFVDETRTTLRQQRNQFGIENRQRIDDRTVLYWWNMILTVVVLIIILWK
jgi:DNA repair exonuclease SbcCD ATPase subunit